jgi:hypothetical protein
MIPLALTTLALLTAAPDRARDGSGLRRLASGIAYGTYDLPLPSPVGDRKLHVVRLDPAKVSFFMGVGRSRSAREWARSERLAVVTNLGMYERDLRTHTGYLRVGQQEHSARWHPEYRSAFAFGPRLPGLPRAALVDLDADADRLALGRYDHAVQNLRLIRSRGGQGENVWRPKRRMWSEAALAQDAQGRVLFLFCRSPYTMDVLARQLLALPLGIRRAQHLEGGSLASLSIHVGGVSLDLAGSYQTGFGAHDRNRGQRPLPNVLGVRVGTAPPRP